MAKQKIFKICDQCNGTGEVVKSKVDDEGNTLPSTEVVQCPRCEGSKYVHWGYLKVEAE